MRAGYIFSVVLIILFSTSLLHSSAAPIYGKVPNVGRPSLQIQKWATANSIELGGTLTVFVNITNWSSQSAFNLSVTEPAFNNFSVSQLQGFEAYEWLEVGQRGSIFYQYTIQPRFEGNFTIEPTEIQFQDENGTQFRALSSFISFFVFTTAPPLDTSELWNTLFRLSAIFMAIPILLLIINRFVWRRS